MTDSPNPYEPPIESASSESAPQQSQRVDYPRGLMTPLIIGLVGATVSMTALFLFDSNIRNPGMFIWLAIGGWSFSFAAVGAYLSGPRNKRIGRAIIAFLLSFPALILYVPVCGILMVGMASIESYGVGFLICSFAAFVVVLFLFAIAIRGSARTLNPESQLEQVPTIQPDALVEPGETIEPNKMKAQEDDNQKE